MMIKQNITETIAINIEGEVDLYYFTVLKDRYEKVPTEYQDAKTLFERFKEFSEVLIAEASDYIGKWEKKASELAEKYRVAPERREKFIYNKTMELMKKDILENNSYFFPYGSLSDILDGGSHDKYQISQGHCPEDGHAYWELPYHLPDEAFADIFSKSYEMYNAILKSIINK